MVATVGHGPKHDAILQACQKGARKNQAQDKFGKSHVKVVSSDSVTDPDEIAADLTLTTPARSHRRVGLRPGTS